MVHNLCPLSSLKSLKGSHLIFLYPSTGHCSALCSLEMGKAIPPGDTPHLPWQPWRQEGWGAGVSMRGLLTC